MYPFSYRASTVYSVGGDYVVINNMGPHFKRVSLSPGYHSSCPSYSSPAVLSDAGDIFAHPPADL